MKEEIKSEEFQEEVVSDNLQEELQLKRGCCLKTNLQAAALRFFTE